MPSQEAAELVSLSWAASIAYEALVTPKPQAAPIYAIGEKGELQRLGALDLAGGRFTAGAARFEFHDGRAPLSDLRIKISELPMAVRKVVALRFPPGTG